MSLDRDIIMTERAKIRPPPQVRALFVAPFRTHGPRGGPPLYVEDASGENVASALLGAPPEARGWGRIQYMAGGDALMDAWAAFFDLLVGDERDLNRVAEVLTEAWRR